MLRHARRPPRTLTSYRPHKNGISRQNDKTVNFSGLPLSRKMGGPGKADRSRTSLQSDQMASLVPPARALYHGVKRW